MTNPAKGIGALHNDPVAATGVNYLLAIAIETYVHLPKLFNCKKDTETFIGLLTQHYRFEEQQVFRVFNQEATLENLHAAFRKLIEKVTPRDNLVVYFSGHGEYDPLTNEGFWIPVEAHLGRLHEYFPNDILRRYLGSIKSHHTFLISDSCFSGALFEEGTGKSGGFRSERDPSRWGLTSGRKEIVSDGKPGKHSPFADALLYRLKNNEGSLGVQKLCADVLEQVEANAFQSPIGEPMRVQGHKNGQFFFHPKYGKAALPSEDAQAFINQVKENEISGAFGSQPKPVGSLFPSFLSWNRFKIILLAALAAIIIGGIIWQAVNISKKMSNWDCSRHYDDCTKIETAEGAYYLVQKAGQWGYANEKGEEIISPRFQEVNPFDSSGLALVKGNNKYGWINRQGEPKIPFEYDKAEPFIEGKAEVAKQGDVFLIDITGTRLVNLPEMVFVQGGPFTMGCTSEQGKNCYQDEKPAHQVKIDSFYIGKYEVFNSEFCVFLNEKGNQYEGGVNWLEMESSKCKIQKKGPDFLPKPGYENHPIVELSWYGARAYCSWLSEKTGKKFRLPSEAEWEFAARGGIKSEKFKYAGGNKVNEVAWYISNSGDALKPVGTRNANELGIYDMSGNVYEWCEDYWHENYNGSPIDGKAWVSSGKIANRIVRGGSYSEESRELRVSFRYREDPIIRYENLGFRIVLDSSPKKVEFPSAQN